MASSCDMANAVADNTDFKWSAFDDIGGVSIMVELIEADEDDFECAGICFLIHVLSCLGG